MNQKWIDTHLTPKQQKAVAAFEKARPGYGAIAFQNILSLDSGWAEIIESMNESEIVAAVGFNSNSGFMHKHLF